MGLPLPQKNFKIFLHLKNGYKLINNKFLGHVYVRKVQEKYTEGGIPPPQYG